MELYGDGIAKQKSKIAEMLAAGYRQPLDFADMAEKLLAGELIEVPMATRSFYLDVGGSASEEAFTSFSFSNGSEPIRPGLPKFDRLKALADNFTGESYSLDDPADRQQMRRRLLRLLHPRARSVLYELAEAYQARYGRPLRVTALTRPVDHQIAVSSTNPNEYVIRDEQSMPPHASGSAFDLARTHMPVDEQNFVMAKLAQMEQEGKLDALILYGDNAAFHVFAYHDGMPPGSTS
jgi:hypothetical protein